MTRLSGWCSSALGCTSPRAHATCGDLIARGLLDGCDCTEHGGHDAPATSNTRGAA